MSLRTSFLATFILFVLIAIAAMWLQGRSLARLAHETRWNESARLQAEALAGSLAGEVDTVFSALHARMALLSEALASGDDATASVSQLMQAFVQADPRILWTGVAGLDGRLIATSGRASVGDMVAEADWFRAGIMGRYVGAASLPSDGPADALPGLATAKVHAVPLASPLKDGAGETSAVFVMLADLAAQDARFEALADRLGVEAALVSADGRVVLGEASRRLTPILGPARLAEARTSVLKGAGPDAGFVFAFQPLNISELKNRPQLTVVTASPIPETLPVFSSDAMAALLGCLGVAVFVATLYAWTVLRPIAGLARQAESVLSNERVYPRDGTGSCEAAALAAAFVKQQQRRGSEQPK